MHVWYGMFSQEGVSYGDSVSNLGHSHRLLVAAVGRLSRSLAQEASDRAVLREMLPDTW